MTSSVLTLRLMSDVLWMLGMKPAVDPSKEASARKDIRDVIAIG